MFFFFLYVSKHLCLSRNAKKQYLRFLFFFFFLPQVEVVQIGTFCAVACINYRPYYKNKPCTNKNKRYIGLMAKYIPCTFPRLMNTVMSISTLRICIKIVLLASIIRKCQNRWRSQRNQEVIRIGHFFSGSKYGLQATTCLNSH